MATGNLRRQWILDPATVTADPVEWIRTRIDSRGRLRTQRMSVPRAQLSITQQEELRQYLQHLESFSHATTLQPTQSADEEEDEVDNMDEELGSNDSHEGFDERLGERLPMPSGIRQNRLNAPSSTPGISGQAFRYTGYYPNSPYTPAGPPHQSTYGYGQGTQQYNHAALGPPQNLTYGYGQGGPQQYSNTAARPSHQLTYGHGQGGSQHYNIDPAQNISPAIPPNISVAHDDQSGYHLAENYTRALRRLGYGNYGVISSRDRRDFFKEGRVFMALWIQTRGMAIDTSTRFTETTLQQANNNSHAQFRRFIVVRNRGRRRNSSVCVAISTHGGRGTLAREAVAANNAQAYSGPTVPPLLAGERRLEKEPIQVELFDQRDALDPASRIDFGQLYEVQHNIAVRNIGTVTGVHLQRVEEYVLLDSGLLSSRIDPRTMPGLLQRN